ncbi:MAG: hypothetical protein Q4E72_12350 [bacterium]|nr:hypothetical protein [bacterium]
MQQHPTNPTPPRRAAPNALKDREKPRDALPTQQPITDDEPLPRAPSRLRRIIRRALLILLSVLALAFVYVVLLLGEPENADDDLTAQPQQRITTPMSAIETPGEANIPTLSASFGEPILTLYGGLPMQKARIYDTAFEGAYARRVTLTYAFDDGALLTLESIRPAAALTLLRNADYRLDASTLYALGGLEAALMQSPSTICVFAQSANAAYALLCPVSHADDLTAILRQTLTVGNEPPQS